ncbi:MAG: lipoyl(octanoyl) transferase LipB [Roseivirga sp.]
MHVPNKQTWVRKLGLITYQAALEVQTACFDELIATKLESRRNAAVPSPTSNYLLFCEHPHVYTLGKSGDLAHLLASQTTLQAQGIALHHTNRGGDITYHGPGQLVVYPILDLENFFTDIHRYLRLLEEAVMATLQDFGLAAGRIQGLTGVWLDPEDRSKASKLCAIGVRTSRWVTMHGLALNVNTDLSYFNQIVPCGLPDKPVTSMAAALGAQQYLPAVAQSLEQHLARLFAMELMVQTNPSPKNRSA